MNIGNITSDNFNLDGNGKDIQIEVYEQLIEQLQQENKNLKENNMSMQEEMARTWEKADLYNEVIDRILNETKETRNILNNNRDNNMLSKSCLLSYLEIVEDLLKEVSE